MTSLNIYSAIRTIDRECLVEVSRTPSWHMILPFAVMVPTTLIPNGSAISLGLVLLTLVIVKGSRASTLAFKDSDWKRWAVIGIGAGIVLWAFSHFIMDPAVEHLLGKIDLSSFAAVKGNLVNYLILLAIGIVYGGVIEELVYRGFVIGWGAELFGERAAVPLLLLSSIVFGLGHLYQSGSGAISAGLTGLAFGAIYLAAGRKLLPAMLAHMTLDSIGITMLYLGYTA